MRLDRLDHLTFDKEGRLQDKLDSANGVKVTLSERNVRAFVAKLDGFPRQSKAMVGLPTDAGMMWVVAHEGAGEPYVERGEVRGEKTAVQVHVWRSNLEELKAGVAQGRMVRGLGSAAVEVVVESNEIHYAGRSIGPGEMNEATESAVRRGKLRSLRPGDKVVRMLAGTIAVKMRVSEVDETFIHCGPWKFNRDFGFEVDEEIGEEGSGVVRPDGSVTPVMSFLDPESIEKAAVETAGSEEVGL